MSNGEDKMPSVSGERVDRRKRLLYRLPFLAFMLVVLQFIAIVPASSFFGGFFYLLFGWWILPTAVNVLLATWAALIFRTQWVLRIILGVSISFLLGVNTALPSLLHLNDLPPPDAVVIRPLPVTHSLAVDTRMVVVNSDIPRDLLLVPPGIDLGGDEGCGCMYWWASAPMYPYRIQGLIDKRGLSVVPGQYQFSDQLPDVAPYNKIVHFIIRFSPSRAARDDFVDMAFDVYQGRDKVATYRQRQLPVAVKEAMGRGEGLLNGHFVANVWSTLMHQGFWAMLLHDRLQRDDYVAPFESFLQQALPPAMQGASSAGEVLAKMPAAALPMKIAQPPPDPHATVRTLKITTEKDSAVDWVTVSAIPEATEPACSSQARVAADAAGATDTMLKGQHLAADRKADGSFEAKIATDAEFKRIKGCQYRLRVTVKFYSKGAVVGDAEVEQDIFRGRGIYEGTCISERVDYPNVKFHMLATCSPKSSDPTDELKRQRQIRSFASNRVFDIRVELEP
jgi:hypothetical protein